MTPAESADATCPTCGGPMGRINGRAPRCRLGHTEERESLGNRWANCNRECDGDHAYTEPCNTAARRG